MLQVAQQQLLLLLLLGQCMAKAAGGTSGG
jgi:hypothetical protein